MYFSACRASRLNDLKNEFCYSFKKASYVILCPVYKAGENLEIKLEL